MTHATCQTFSFLTRRWCITRALELITSGPNAAHLVERADITRLDPFLPSTKPTLGYVKLLEFPVDPTHAATVDLTTPIVVARLLSAAGDDLGAMVIDGWHRIYRARAEGLTHLPAHVLTADTERAARIPVSLARRS